MDDPFGGRENKTWEPPPSAATSDLTSTEPHRPLNELPVVTPVLDDVQKNENAKQTEMVGQAIRTGLGIGALALIPDLIEDLRRTRDPDARLKFITLAMKEGGYGVKEDKGGNLPVFHFNFDGGGAVSVTQEKVKREIEDATYVEQTPTPTALALAAPQPEKTIEPEDFFASLGL